MSFYGKILKFWVVVGRPKMTQREKKVSVQQEMLAL